MTVVAEGDYDPIEEVLGLEAICSFSAVFAEVCVDPDPASCTSAALSAPATPEGLSIPRRRAAT